MRVCIVANAVEASLVLMQFSDIDAIIQTAENDLISTFLFRFDCLYADALKGVQSNFGWHVKFSPERHYVAPVLGPATLLKTKIRSIVPSSEPVEFLEYHRLAKT